MSAIKDAAGAATWTGSIKVHDRKALDNKTAGQQARLTFAL